MIFGVKNGRFLMFFVEKNHEYPFLFETTVWEKTGTKKKFGGGQLVVAPCKH